MTFANNSKFPPAASPAVPPRESARELIAKSRKGNYALSSGARDLLEREFPEDLEGILNGRRALGATTRM
jgi:hypothetical protein